MAVSDIFNRRIRARPDEDEEEEFYSESSASVQESDNEGSQTPDDLSDEAENDSDDSLKEQDSDRVSLSFFGMTIRFLAYSFANGCVCPTAKQYRQFRIQR